MRILNSELADTLGNLLSRVCAKSVNNRQISPALHRSELDKLLQEDVTKKLVLLCESLPGEFIYFEQLVTCVSFILCFFYGSHNILCSVPLYVVLNFILLIELFRK